MTQTNFSMQADDDLPRTFRRARREQDAQMSGYRGDPGANYSSAGYADDEPPPVTVRFLKIPFFRLMLFFIKAAFAAIPALIILTGLAWVAGEFLTIFFPELLKMKITIQLPN